MLLLQHVYTAKCIIFCFSLSLSLDGLVNDTLTGDPLFTVPILTAQSNQSNISPADIPSLCYEVHGRAEEYFNLISDTCTSVNAFYQKAPVNSSEIDLNVVTKIGVRAVGDDGTCHNIAVDLDTCTASINGAPLTSKVYSSSGIRIRWNVNNSRVRIGVPNCADTLLVMWVFCGRGQIEDPVTCDVSFIRFVVMRGLNLNELSHGLIGNQNGGTDTLAHFLAMVVVMPLD